MTRVLLVEDEVPLLQSIAFTLRRHGFDVRFAANGTTAIDIIVDQHVSEQPIDILITDLQLPVMHGLEMLATLQSRDMAVPTLVFTAHGSAEMRDQLASMDVVEVLDKPFSAEALIERVSALVAESAGSAVP